MTAAWVYVPPQVRCVHPPDRACDDARCCFDVDDLGSLGLATP